MNEILKCFCFILGSIFFFCFIFIQDILSKVIVSFISGSRLCVKALLESKISQGFEGFEDFICTGLYGFVPSSISSGTVRCYNRCQNLFSINP